MPRSVSVPEKTLEHWSSQYVIYLYRSKAALWWPASGQDIDVRWLPARPGKAVQLELKTTTVVRPGVHDVMVDLGQLWEYRNRRPGWQPFYAFPRPDWKGDLAVEALAGGRAVTELAFARSGSGWWFADWMVVLTTAQVAAILRRDLAADGSERRGPKRRLVRFEVSHSGATTTVKATWGSRKNPAAAPQVIRWRDFWPTLDQCGQAGWPQLIRLPRRLIDFKRAYPHQEVVWMFRAEEDVLSGGPDINEPFVTLEPGADGNYQVTEDPSGGFDRSAADAAGRSEDHRLVVFLDARALRPAWNGH